ncbi:SulP family inorganic anion transporter [Leptolyngbya sp. NIES-2104]|uniref:SulP family inorganic anion transporter n=1 Tax=Leptolyngbya sp. NIES-2104 TaxID=1552121 RepID=UPI0006EC6803|nr:SulP family inorganic anion transporter [Leptolyngbya sp. NIES-2104]GAP94293.1 sulfate transporter [Leptolyngbya sp. NIES-2104]
MTPLTSEMEQQELPPSKLLPNVLAGLAVGLVSLTYDVSFAALIFSGSLSAYFPQGLGSALISSVIVGAIVALRSSFPFAIAGPDSNSAAILALMVSAIAKEIQLSGQLDRLFPTIWMAISLSSLLAGLFLYAAGRLSLGRWARFIPYPVMSGFLAGTGWLITRSSFKVMVGLPLEWSELPRLIEIPNSIRWLPGVLFAGLLIGITKFSDHALVLPATLLGAIVFFNVFWHLLNVFVSLSPQGWFLEPFSSGQILHSWSVDSLTRIDWQVLIDQSGTLVALIVVVVTTILLNTTGVELSSEQDSTLNGELCTNGIANLAVAPCGGMVGYLSFNRTLLHRSAGANSRISGLISAAFCGTVLVFGFNMLTYIPRPILGGVLLMIGIKLLLEWVVHAWFKFPYLDYALILIILVSIAIWGFISGVAIGVMIACALFIFRYSQHHVIRHQFSGTTYPSRVCRSSPEQGLLRHQGDHIQILRLQGYVFFGTANMLLEQVSQRLQDSALPLIQFLVLDFRLVSGLDSSAVLSFIKMRQLLQKHSAQLVLTHLNTKILQQLQRGNCIVAQDIVVQTFADLDRGIEWCENQILEARSMRRRRSLPLALHLNEFFVNADHVAHFMHYLQKTQIPAEHLLFRQGESSDTLYFIESGQVTVVLTLSNGKTRRLRTFGAGMILGENSFFLDTPHKTSAIADQSSTLYTLSKTNLQIMRQDQPHVTAAFQDFIIRLLADRLLYTYAEIEELF